MTLRPISEERARRLAAQTDSSLVALIVVYGGGKQSANTTRGATRAECRGLRSWSERKGDDAAGSLAASTASEKS
jgi:hypothetical protein